MVTLAVLPGKARASLAVAKLANPGNSSGAINLLVPQSGIVGLGYNLIRGVIVKAAEAHDTQPRRLSFEGTLQRMTAFRDALRRVTPRDRDRSVRAMLEVIARHEAADR